MRNRFVFLLFFILFFLFTDAPMLSKASTHGLKQQAQKIKNKQTEQTLKKAQRIACATVKHPLVYGPPLILIYPPFLAGTGLIVFSTGGLLSLLLPEGMGLLGSAIVTGATVLSAYASGCLYALKKAFDAEREQKKDS